MIDFLKAIPNTTDLPTIFDFLEAKPLSFSSQKHLLWLKNSIQNAIYLIENHYLPLSDQSEEDICSQVWQFVVNAFNVGKLTAKRAEIITGMQRGHQQKKKNSRCNFSAGDFTYIKLECLLEFNKASYSPLHMDRRNMRLLRLSRLTMTQSN